MVQTIKEDKLQQNPIEVIESLSKVIFEISNIQEHRGPFRKLSSDLSRRIKLLSPLFDEIHDRIRGRTSEGFEIEAYFNLLNCLDSAKDLLKLVNDGSKLYQALQRELYIIKFQEVTRSIDNALNHVPYHDLDISEEVKEQIELVHAQFRRAKEKEDSPDLQLHMDLSLARTGNPVVLKRLSEKLQLKSMNDLKQESIALHEMVISNGEPMDCLEEMSSILKRLKECNLIETPVSENVEPEESSLKYRSPVIPDDFRCPISLELMRDPVIVSTGQTYERSCIQKWLDSGHKTCPKTQQNLSHTALTPNFVLKSLISQWCEANGIQPPKKISTSRDKKPNNRPECDRATIKFLLEKLKSTNQEEQRAAAGEIRLLAKRNTDNRICIAEAGAIPLLVNLLSSQDSRTQEHSVTALLNLSIHEANKSLIVSFGAISEIVKVLKDGGMEARENAAATLFSLSALDSNKITIGEAGAIPPLIRLLSEGSPRGKKDAATALYNLVIYQGNKVKAVKDGIVIHLLRLVEDSSGGMVDEALAILAILVSSHEGRSEVRRCEAVPVFVDILKNGSLRNREKVASILWMLCTSDGELVMVVRDLGGEEPLKELVEGGSDRAKRKASTLLELIQKD